MKKILFICALCLAALTGRASTDYQYLAAITSVSVDTLASKTKNVFYVTFEQTCKRTDMYSSSTVYKSTGYLVLNSDDRTLEGTYTTDGASSTSSSANVNDQTINLVTSYYKIDNNTRKLNPDKISTFTIKKLGDDVYSITIGELHFKSINGAYTYNFSYCYDEEEINTEGISPKDFVFSYNDTFVPAVYNYDMTVNGIVVERNDNSYGSIRYFLRMSCVGKNLSDNSERNYEVQLDILPDEEAIDGTFGTQSGQPLFALESYVKDLKIGKTRYLAKDSANVIQIQKTGENSYRFFGGTLICTDIDANYQAVYGKKRIEAVHYYHFSDEGTDFGYDESNKTADLEISKVTVDEILDGFQLDIKATNNGLNTAVHIEIESEAITGAFNTTSGLSLWSKVTCGSIDSYVAAGATVTINHKNGNKYTLSGSLLCENGYTYVLKSFDFQYGEDTAAGVEGVQSTDRFTDRVQKVLRNGQVIIVRDGKGYNVLGIEL